jgi:hypothetical protein
VGTLNPRPRGGASLSGELRASRDDRQQIRRLLSTQPKPKAATVVSSGGIVGMAQVVSTSGSVVWSAASSIMSKAGVTYAAPTDPYAGSPGAAVVPVSSWVTVSGYQLALTPGWYNLAMSIRIEWSSQAGAPLSLSAYAQGGWDAAHNDRSEFALAQIGSASTPRWGLAQVVSNGPTFINEGDLVWAESHSPTSAAAANVSGSIVWDITKLG